MHSGLTRRHGHLIAMIHYNTKQFSNHKDESDPQIDYGLLAYIIQWLFEPTYIPDQGVPEPTYIPDQGVPEPTYIPDQGVPEPTSYIFCLWNYITT